MKTLLFLLGCLLALHALSSIYMYVFDFEKLALYGKGYLSGKLILLGISACMLYYSLKPYFFKSEGSGE